MANDTAEKAATGKLRYLLDPYLDWTKEQQIPVVEGIAVDLNAVETQPWPRLGKGCRAAFVHLKGRGDFVALLVVDLDPGASTTLARHLFDEVFYVLSGSGSATVDLGSGRSRSFEWGPRALFSVPLNAPYRLFNGSGRDRARLVVAYDLPFYMNFFRSEGLLFDNPFAFPERVGRESFFNGEGEFLPLKPGQHMWETNLVPDLGSFELPEWETRGAGSRNIKFILADSPMHAHTSEMAVGTYKKAHAHGPGAHVFAVTGSGYTLMWSEGDQDFERHEWRHGWVFAPPDDVFHQHFNTGPEPARYLALSLGSHRYPILARKVARKTEPEKSVKHGGIQIDYVDQDPRIHSIWLKELAKTGVASRMGKYFDEDRIRTEGA
jgi:mannose-6-phosphate isomerase-like protein (cupin superfamily)